MTPYYVQVEIALGTLTRRIVVVADEGAVTSAREEPCVDQRAEHRVARGRVEPPEPLRLLRRQPQPRHLEELSSNASNHFLDCPSLSHRSPVV